MLNRLTLLYSKIYYKKENYLKVRTAVFKYITPPIVKVEYIIFQTLIIYYLYNLATPYPIVPLVLLILPFIYLLRNPTTGASIGEPCTLAYTLCTAYVSYA